MFGVSLAFYGAPKTRLWTESRDLLRSLHKKFSVSWIYPCDFNELLKSHEKLGGCLRPYGQMEKFREVLDECGLFDLGFSGNKFTWSKSYPNWGIVWERLDQAVSSAEWFELFPITKVQTLTCVSSDHHPIIILLEGFCGKPQRPWRFEQLWLVNRGCTIQWRGLGYQTRWSFPWRVLWLRSMRVKLL